MPLEQDEYGNESGKRKRRRKENARWKSEVLLQQGVGLSTAFVFLLPCSRVITVLPMSLPCTICPIMPSYLLSASSHLAPFVPLFTPLSFSKRMNDPVTQSEMFHLYHKDAAAAAAAANKEKRSLKRAVQGKILRERGREENVGEG